MSIRVYDDFDELFEAMERDRRAVDARVLPWQEAISPGHYTMRRGPGFPIYSEILEDPELRDKRLRNYRFTRSYSVACPGGELGDIHVSTIERVLTRQEFLRARERSWTALHRSRTATETEPELQDS